MLQINKSHTMNDKFLSVMLALAQREFDKADILYSAAKDTIFVFDNDIKIAEVVGGSIIKDSVLWHENKNSKITNASDKIGAIQPVKNSVKTGLLDETKFNWKNADWDDCFDACLDPRHFHKDSSLTSDEVIRLMRKRAIKKRTLHHKVSKKEFEKMHLMVRINHSAKQHYVSKGKNKMSKVVTKPKFYIASKNKSEI